MNISRKSFWQFLNDIGVFEIVVHSNKLQSTFEYNVLIQHLRYLAIESFNINISPHFIYNKDKNDMENKIRIKITELYPYIDKELIDLALEKLRIEYA